MDHERRSREVYGRSAPQYLVAVGSEVSDRFEAPEDLAVLDRAMALARPVGRRALDVGCGTGRITRVLGDHGFAAVGVDVAPGMVDIARREHPDLSFAVGALADLPAADDQVALVTSWYSIITTPPDELDGVWAELTRVLAPGGVALVAFQAGAGESVERPDAYGTGVDLTLHRHDVDHVVAGLRAASSAIVEVVERPPTFDHEDTPQAFVIVRAPAPLDIVP